MLTRSSCLSFRRQPVGRCASFLNLRIWLFWVWLLLPPLSLHSQPSHQCTTQPRGRPQWRPRWVAFLLSKALSSAHRVVCRLPWRDPDVLWPQVLPPTQRREPPGRECVMSGRSARNLLADTAVQTMSCDQGSALALMRHTKAWT